MAVGKYSYRIYNNKTKKYLGWNNKATWQRRDIVIDNMKNLVAFAQYYQKTCDDANTAKNLELHTFELLVSKKETLEELEK